MQLLNKRQKNAMCSEVTGMINAIGVQKRTIDQVKYKWGNLLQGAKSFCAARKHSKITGGGPPPKPPTSIEVKIIDMMKDRPNFSGVVGGFESSMPAIDLASTSSSTTTLEDTTAEPELLTQSSPEENNLSKSRNEENDAAKVETLPDVAEQEPAQKRPRKITLGHLQQMQYEVLFAQKEHMEVKNLKLRSEIERSSLEKENLRLRNQKLELEITILKQTITQNENALLALEVISD